MAKTEAVWHEIDPASLHAEAAEAYGEYKRLYRAAKDAREVFEASMSKAAALPSDKRMVFGYNFGKLSVAVVENDVKLAKHKPRQSLSSFMDTLKAQGRRT
jgi:hypothetical protein